MQVRISLHKPADCNYRQHQSSTLGQSQILNPQTSQPSTESVGSSWSRFEIPTKNDSLSSGFPFHPRLYDLKVTHDEWSLFSSDIVNSAKLKSSKDLMAWVTGITTGTVTSPVLLVFGPVAGYYTGRLIHRKTIVKTVRKKLGREGDLRSVLRRWNKETFEERGFQAWLELPLDPGELNKEYLVDETLESTKAQMKAAKKAARRFRIIIIPNDDPVPTTAESASGELPPNILPLAQAAMGEDRTPQELHDTVLQPPEYSPGSAHGNLLEKDRQGQDRPQASRSVPSEASELYAATAESVKYIRSAESSNPD